MPFDTPILTRLLPGGRVVPWWKADRVRLPHEILHSVAYLYADEVAALDGDTTGAATAFWVSVEFRPGIVPQGAFLPFLVTNRHVIEGGATALRWMGCDGTSLVREIPEKEWRFPSNPNLDLAIWPVTPDIDGKIFPISTSIFVAQQSLEQLDVRIGDDLVMVGRHLGFDGKTTNTPTARFGNLCQFPSEEIRDDNGRSHKCYLAQMPSLPGFSGSPVFLFQNQIEKNAEKGMVAFGQNPRTWGLLGVNSGHLHSFAATYMKSSGARNDALISEINTGINVVIPAWDLADALEDILRKEFY